jgi:cytochrome P450
MALYPEIQAAAQAELDQVLTDGRMPQLSDRASLPYVECVMREVLRWNPVVPLGSLFAGQPTLTECRPRIATPADQG